MKKPTWVTIVGVLGIVFGVFGLLCAGQIAMTPKMLQMDQEMREANVMNAPPEQPDWKTAAERANKAMETMLGHQPEWFGPICVGLGFAGLIVNVLYIFGGVALLQLKPYSVKLFSSVLWFSIPLTGIARGIISTQGGSFMGMALLIPAAVEVILDTILLIVIATADKSVFSTASNARLV